MPVALAVVAAVEIGTTVASTIAQKQATDAAANAATQTAAYNAKVDAADAAQIDSNTQANIAAMRRDASVYMSRQASAYARGGIVANTGSALATEAATAGRFAMKEQQTWNDANAREEGLASQAAAGVAEGTAQANEYHLEGISDIMSGASKVASQAYGAYEGGAFGSPGSSTSTALSTSTPTSFDAGTDTVANEGMN